MGERVTRIWYPITKGWVYQESVRVCGGINVRPKYSLPHAIRKTLNYVVLRLSASRGKPYVMSMGQYVENQLFSWPIPQRQRPPTNLTTI